jgi:hypothetical protein
MSSPDKGRWGRKCRVAFRRFRFCLWMSLFVLLAALVYLNQVGLPDFIKRPLLDKLHARGLDLQFTRLRWHWDRGLVAENVLFGHADDTASPRLALREAAVELNLRALLRGQVQVDSLRLRQGRLTWPIPATNGPPQELCVDEIEARLRLLPEDLWALEHFQAQWAGARLRLTATIANASAVRDWSVFHTPAGATSGDWQRRLRQWSDTIGRIHFVTAPELTIEAQGDARDWHSFVALLKLDVAAAETPWGKFEQALLTAKLSPVASNGCPHAKIQLQAGRAETPWAVTTNLALVLDLSATETDVPASPAAPEPAAGRVETPRNSTTNTPPKSRPPPSAIQEIAFAIRGELQLTNTTTRWGGVRSLRFIANLASVGGPAPPADPALGWWTNLAPYTATWNGDATGVRSPRLDLDDLAAGGRWSLPDLQVTQLVARISNGRFAGQARLDAATRRLQFGGASDLDLRKLALFLPPEHQNTPSEFTWDRPPALQVDGALILPAWTNRQPDWRREIESSLALNGQVHLDKTAYRGVMVYAADTHFTCSNALWRFPDLVVKRPEGNLEVFSEADARTGAFTLRLRSGIDPLALRPWFAAKSQRTLELFEFTQPPSLDAEAHGNWNQPGQVDLTGRVAITNFAFRGQTADGLQSALTYSNRVLKLIEPRLQRDHGTQYLAAASVTVDGLAEKVCITNGFAVAEPLVVARAIGPNTGLAFEPYRFLQPPSVRVEGTIPFHGEQDGDLHCEVDGGAFAWWKFKVPRITGQLHWVKDRLRLEEVQTEFYRGSATGQAEFTLTPRQPTQLSFAARVTNADLHLLMGDLSTRTNRFEGLLNGRLEVTQGLAANGQTWQGRGRVSLRDGLIWEFPLFGVLSPVLDGVVPGLGSSRANEGTASFTLTNGVLFSDNLVIHASMMRLQYWGTTDLQGRVNARAQAELLRDTWVVGRVLSLALWPVSKIFLYKITGTLSEPKSDPVFFVPRIVLLPFQAFRAIKEPTPESPPPPQPETPPATSH